MRARGLLPGQGTMQLITPSSLDEQVRSAPRARWLALCASVLVLVTAGCASRVPRLPQSEGHVTKAQTAQPDNAIPPPARESVFVPPPKPAVKVPTYSVVVTEVPVKELLQALARDTKQNIDIHPSLEGRVSLNAINETLPAILDRIANQVDLRYRTEGNSLIVSPDTAYMKTYIVNYVNIERKTTSTTGASGQIGTAGGAGGAAGGGGAATNASSTSVTTTSNSDFWVVLEKSVRAILNSSLYQRQKVAEIARSMRQQQEQDLRTRQAEAASRATPAGAAGSPPPTAAPVGGASSTPATVLVVQPEDVIVNAVAGTITVNGNESQHKLVLDYLTKVESGAQRQVLIEATIVEVGLSDAYQGGIDWSRLATTGGLALQQRFLSGFGSGLPNPSSNSMTIAYTTPTTLNPDSRLGNISATIKLLDQFGVARVLSSPKLMVLNNQTALLKAVDNIVYFEVSAQASTTQGVSTQVFNTAAKTVATGIVMGVTPQVNEDGRVLLTVRPTVSRLLGFVNDPNPSLCDSNRGNCIQNPVPQVQVREMESVLQVGSGQTVILGGLMQDNVQRSRESLPGAGSPANTGFFSELFGFRSDRVTKSELVIFIRPTVIANPTLESEELKFFQRFLPQQTETPTPPAPREKAGAAR